MPEDQPHRTDMLVTGRSLYDAVRPLFDISNDMGLVVGYLDGERARPHLSDRIIVAEFEPTNSDVIELSPMSTGPIGRYINDTEARVSMRMYPANSRMSEYPDGISLMIYNGSWTSSGIGGILLPEGSIAPRMLGEGEVYREFHSTNVRSIFGLVAKLIEEKRLRPTAKFI